jgi:glycosyltransferase involved in cell wall biosynthesis
MERWPRISIVTPSFNQAQYIAATIESVMAQDYPNLEHIVIDGSSTDGTLEGLRRYPHLKLVSEPDGGHADAINKGFRLATGDIWAFLNSDDTLLPGALHRVAAEIDPANGRHIVMGRCRFIDAQGRFIGIEHPSQFQSHRRVLQVWKGHTIPQPAVFWTPEVWKTCGPMDDGLKSPWIDYDLFCRFSRRYRFHFVNQVLATYRLHSESKTERWTEAERLEDAIGLSRRHWGTPLSPMYVRLVLSLAVFRLNRLGRARQHLCRAGESWQRGDVVRAILNAIAATVLAPAIAFYVGIYPALRGGEGRFWRRVVDQLGQLGSRLAQTPGYLDRTECWSDGWVGPRLVADCETARPARSVGIRGWVDLQYMSKPLLLTVRMDSHIIGQHRIEEPGDFAVRIPVPDPVDPGTHRVEVEASTWFVPHRFTGSGDFRPLAWRLGEVELEGGLELPLDRTECWGDGWVGPRLVVDRETAIRVRSVGIRGWADLRYLSSPLVLTVRMDSHIIGQHRIEEPGDFAVRIPVPDPVDPGTHRVEVEASTWFVPHRFTGSGDFRLLAWRLGDVKLEGGPDLPLERDCALTQRDES